MKWNRQTRICICACVVLFCMSGCSALEKAEQARVAEDDAYVIVLPTMEMAEEGTICAVEEELNGVFRDELGVSVTLELVPVFKYTQTLEKRLASGKQTDIMVNLSNDYLDFWMREELLSLDDLIDRYGQDIVEAVGEVQTGYCRIDGTIYGLPNVRDYAVQTDTYYLNKKILERNQIDISQILTIEELEEAFAIVHEREPDIIIAYTTLQSLCANSYYLSGISSYPIGVLEDNGQGECYINYFETNQYRQQLQRVRTWYEAGYIKMAVSGNEVMSEEGEVFAYVRCGKPGAEAELAAGAGDAFVELSFGDTCLMQDSYMAVTYSISRFTCSPEMSMKILNCLYRDPVVNQALVQVIPGWMVPNLFLTVPMDGYAEDIWEQTKVFNDSALLSRDVGFVFDPSEVMQEYIEVSGIYSRYRSLLENGLVEWEANLQRMNEEMSAAGIDKIIEEKNRQYNEWKKHRI